MSSRVRSRFGRLALTLSASGVLFGTSVAPALAGSPDHLQLSTDGIRFHPSLTAPLFQGSARLVPGSQVQAGLWARNGTPDPGQLSISVAMPAAGDAGELMLLIEAPGRTSMSRPIAGLEAGQLLLRPHILPARATEGLTISISLPAKAVGQKASADGMVLRVDLGQDADDVSLTPQAGGSMASTGFDLNAPVVLGACLVTAGWLVIMAGRRRADPVRAKEHGATGQCPT